MSYLGTLAIKVCLAANVLVLLAAGVRIVLRWPRWLPKEFLNSMAGAGGGGVFMSLTALGVRLDYIGLDSENQFLLIMASQFGMAIVAAIYIAMVLKVFTEATYRYQREWGWAVFAMSVVMIAGAAAAVQYATNSGPPDWMYWGLLVLALLLVGIAFVRLRRQWRLDQSEHRPGGCGSS